MQYQEQQSFRSEHANLSYREQEEWLIEFFGRLHERHPERTYRVLDFGCGFGRIGRLLCELDYIEYYGYDFSSDMMKDFTLDPPQAIAADFEQRVRVADKLEEAFPPCKQFDFVLTISVFIHNTPAWVRDTLKRLDRFLASDGRIILIENRHTAVTSMENFWHGGCWTHSFARYFNGVADLEIFGRCFLDRHGAYIAAPHSEPRESRFLYHSTLSAEGEDLSFSEVLARGLEQAELNAATLMAEFDQFGTGHAELSGKVHDLTEELAIAREQAAKTDVRLAEMEHRFFQRQKLSEDLATAFNAFRWRERDRGNEQEQKREVDRDEIVEWNSALDIRHSHRLPELDNVLHVFAKEWMGIRAATGYLPGNKLAVSANADLSADQMLGLFDVIAAKGFSRIVFHGLPSNSHKLIEFLYQRGLKGQLYLVVHGSPVQWIFSQEREMAFQAIRLLKSQKIKKLHIMKRGFEMDIPDLFRPMLFNISPKNIVSGCSNKLPQLEGVAFSAGWSGWIKNVHTNVFGAALSSKINTVWHYARDIDLPAPLNTKLVEKNFTTREATFDIISLASLCLNVTLADCHPMFNIEAQSLGRPCLRGNLHLDTLEDHPYVSMCSVEDVSSVKAIKEQVEYVIDVPDTEREELILDYQHRSDAVALARYLEFLEI